MDHLRSSSFQLVPIFFGLSLRAIQEKKSFELICKKWQDFFFSSNTLGNGQRKP